MFRYNLYAFLGLCCCIALIVLLHDKAVGEILLKVVAGLLLLYKLGYYIHKNITITFCAPVEFSAQSYFLVPALLFINKRSCHVVAGFLGLLCGLGFFAGYSLAGFYLVQKLPSDAFFTAVVCHGVLLLIGVYCCRRQEMQKKDRYFISIALLLMAVWALVFYPVQGVPANLFVWTLLKPPFLFPATNPWQIPATLGYYAVLILGIVCVTEVFFLTTKKLHALWRKEEESVLEGEVA